MFTKSKHKWLICFFLLTLAGCTGKEEGKIELVLSQGKVLGKGREAMDMLFGQFEKMHPGVKVLARELPNSTDEQHQYYLTSLGGGASDVDVVAMDVIWVSEFARNGWLVSIPLTKEQKQEFLSGPLEACTYKKELKAIPWFTDAGLLYYRDDLLQKYGKTPPQTWDDLISICQEINKKEPDVPYGLIFQGKQYEGEVCAFLEILGGCGARVLEEERAVLDSPEGIQAFSLLRDLIYKHGVVPRIINNMDEEGSRRTFMAGEAIFLRNWPYVWSNIQQEGTLLKDKVRVTTIPHMPGKDSVSTLGGWQLGVNSFSKHKDLAIELAKFMTGYEAQKILAIFLARNPTLKSMYKDTDVLKENPFMKDLFQVFTKARPRPVTHLYPKISQILQTHISEVISDTQKPEDAAKEANQEIQNIFKQKESSPISPLIPLIAIGIAIVGIFVWMSRKKHEAFKESATAFLFLGPSLLVIIAVALLPLIYAFVISFYDVEYATIISPTQWAAKGFGNFFRLLEDSQFTRALYNTFAITVASVSLELMIGLGIALLLSRPFLGRGPLRALVLLPWILPTVVAAKMWSWVFEHRGVANYILIHLGFISDGINWLDPMPAFISIVIAEVWKTTPFMAILLIAGLSTIPADLYSSAKVDGASRWYTFTRITLPLLKPTILLALLFRTMDALRLFDVVYVMTHNMESTKTLSIYVYQVMTGAGEVGYASALSLVTFTIIFCVSLLYLALLGKKMGVQT